MEISLEDGKFLVKLARNVVEKFLETGKVEIVKSEKYSEKSGCFVTIETWPSKELRGCMGYPYPELPLYEAVQRAALDAAFNDPRFPSLTKKELNNVVFEVSVLTKPVEVEIKRPEDVFVKIEKGKQGVILENSGRRALFLPQVWEQLPTHEEFLSHLCMKAGLLPDCWLDRNTRFFVFRVIAFAEEAPFGKIKRIS